MSFFLPGKYGSMDPSPNSLYQYMITLTSPDGFCDAQEDQVVQWHKRNSEKCFLVSELHDSGAKHYHSLISCMAPKTANKVTDKLVRLYCALGIDYVKRVSVKVRAVSDFIGVLHYLSKDIPLGSEPLYLSGWRYTWIKDQCIKHVKHIPHKLLKKNEYMVQCSTCVALVLRYAAAASHPLTGKESFISVVVAMQAEGYCFSKVKPKWLYGELMARVGQVGLTRRLWEDALFGLD